MALLKLTGTPAADKLPYLTGASGAALADLTAAGRALLDDANASAQLTTLGVSVFVKPFLAAATELTAFQALGGNTGAGWFRLPGGLLCQFGSSIVSVAGGGGGAQITLPTAYTTATSYSKVAMNGESGSGNIMVNEYRTGYPTAAAFYVVLANASGPVPNGTYRINWLTMGS